MKQVAGDTGNRTVTAPGLLQLEQNYNSYYHRRARLAAALAGCAGRLHFNFLGGTEGILCKWAGGAGLRRRFLASGLGGFVMEDGDANPTIHHVPPSERPLPPTG